MLFLAYYIIICLSQILLMFFEHVIRNSAPDEVESITAQMANFKEMYKNPLFAILISQVIKTI